MDTEAPASPSQAAASPSQAAPHRAAGNTPKPGPKPATPRGIDVLAPTVERPRPPEVDAVIAARDAAKKRDTDKPKFLDAASAAATMVHDPDTPPPEVPKRPSFADAKTAMSPDLAPTALGGHTVGPRAPTSQPSSGPHGPPGPVTPPPDGGPMQPMQPPSGPHGMPPPHGMMPPPHGMMPPPPGMMPPGSYPPTGYPPPYGMHPGMAPGAPPLGSMSGLPLPAHLMSPAPGGYHAGHDLAHLANQPIRRIPPWGLAVLFVAAIVGALVLTIVIAKLAS